MTERPYLLFFAGETHQDDRHYNDKARQALMQLLVDGKNLSDVKIERGRVEGYEKVCMDFEF